MTMTMMSLLIQQIARRIPTLWTRSRKESSDTVVYSTVQIVYSLARQSSDLIGLVAHHRVGTIV